MKHVNGNVSIRNTHGHKSIEQNNRGSAYTFIIMMTLLLFMIISITLAVTAQSRRITARYTQYASLYEMAVAGNERTFFELNAALAAAHDDIAAWVYHEIAQTEDMTAHLVYRANNFHLAYPEDAYYEKLYKVRAQEMLEDKLRNTYQYTEGEYKTAYHLNITLTAPDEMGTSIIDTYHIETTLRENTEGGALYTIQTAVTKSVNGEQSHPTVVEAEIRWPTQPHEELFLPVYTWGESAVPFTGCLYAAGEINIPDAEADPLNTAVMVSKGDIPFEDIIDTTGIATLKESSSTHMLVTSQSSLDVSALYHNGSPQLTAVVHLGEQLTLYASDSTKNQFMGILVCFGDLTLSSTAFTGTAIVNGAINVTGNVTLTPSPEMLFTIPLPKGIRESFYNFLKLTHFHQGYTDIKQIIGRLTFDMEAKNGEAFKIEINNFDAGSLTMVKSKKIAN